jgi:RNA polymerase sigma-70 factor (ECF subfamily)
MPDLPAEDARAQVGRLYDAHGAALYRYALMVLADAGAAEDVVQQVFTSLLRSPANIEDGFELHYLRRAVRNECYSTLRRSGRLRPSGRPMLEPVTGEEHIEERLALERAIRMLAPGQREVLHLHVFEGMTFREVAEAAGESINTIASRYRYAIQRLREMLD